VLGSTAAVEEATVRRILPGPGRLGAALVATALLLAIAGCASSGNISRRLGTIVGTIVIEFENESGPELSESAQRALRERHPFYRLQLRRNAFLGPRSWITARRGEPVTPFSASLREGSYRITHLFLRRDRGTDTSQMIDALAGFNLRLAIDVPVERSAVTYIGRLRLRVPSRVRGTATPSSVVIEDASAEDLSRFEGIVRGDGSGARVELATVEVEEVREDSSSSLF